MLFQFRFLQHRIDRLLQLVPKVHPTKIVMDTMADLQHVPVEVVALQYQEFDLLFNSTLGTHISGAPFHYLMQQQQQQQQHHQAGQELQIEAAAVANQTAVQTRLLAGLPAVNFGPQEQQEWTIQQMHAQDGIAKQLLLLKQLLGAELAHAAVHNTPNLLAAPIQQIETNLQWLQWQLRLSPVAAMLLAQQHGSVLLLPPTQLQSNYSNLCYLLQQLLGWRIQQVHTLLYNSPQLLTASSKTLASNWQTAQWCCRRRSAWARELAAASPTLVTDVLTGQQHQLLMLQYAADTGDLRRHSMIHILHDTPYVDFVVKCPGFRLWRAMGLGRWRLEFGAAQTAATAFGRTGGIGSNGDVLSGDAQSAVDVSSHIHPGADAGMEPPRDSVLARDALNRPVLVQVGQLGPNDRLF